MSAALPDAEARARAVDPARSVIVQAPAGSGKTSLLVERYLNLLRQVDEPEEIIAITFTRKAAGEMRDRVLERLEAPSDIAETLNARSEARGWNLTEDPQRLRIQTIDSFAYALVQRLPFRSRFGLEYGFIDDARWMYDEAAARVLARAAAEDPLADEIADFMAYLENDHATAVALLAEMLSRRDQWIEPISEIAAIQTGSEPERFVRARRKCDSPERCR